MTPSRVVCPRIDEAIFSFQAVGRPASAAFLFELPSRDFAGVYEDLFILREGLRERLGATEGLNGLEGKGNVLAMNIVLIGYRCTGKTSVGRILSQRLGKEFVDTDVLIEKRTGCSIERIVAEGGWDRFRLLESEVIVDVSIRDEQVIATGGGIVMDWRNVENLEKKGRLIWLQGDARVIKKRMYDDRQAKVVRPSLTGDDPLEEIKQVLSLRIPLYDRAASFAVDTSGSSIQDVAETIIRHLAEEAVRS